MSEKRHRYHPARRLLICLCGWFCAVARIDSGWYVRATVGPRDEG